MLLRPWQAPVSKIKEETMKRKCILLVLLCFMVIMLFPSVPALAEDTHYTYTYDWWGLNRESPDAYEANTSITGDKLGIGDFLNPQGFFVRDNLIYVCDTGNNRIVVIEKADGVYRLKEVITEFTGETDINTFSGPMDIFVTGKGEFYICDTENQRVVHLNANRELVKELVRPADETVDQESSFYPQKVVVDSSGRAVVLVKNYNKGFVEYKNTGEFSGFIGANEVKFNMIDYIWKRFATKEQRAQMETFVPTEYNNLALDKDEFIYCTTSVFKERELQNDKAKPIRKLNAMGTDILVRNGEYPPIGDLMWGNAAGVSGASKFVDVTAMDNDTYFVIDRTRGRIFGYDFQGNLLYAFGSLGNRMGYFNYPTALEHMDNNLLVLDSGNVSITVFSLTQYGQLINDALMEYKRGNYDTSAAYWEEVLTQNGNYDLAYIGIGRSLLRQGNYKKAMEYFKLKYDEENYSKAFQLYRKQWIEEKIGWIVSVFFTIIILPSLIGFVKKIKREVEEE
jgi:DNA-binding beta-propeller fold protein YncE